MSYREPEDTRWDDDGICRYNPWDSPIFRAEYEDFKANCAHDDDEKDGRDDR